MYFLYLRVADKSSTNLMTVANLGVCFGPSLMRPKEESVAGIMDIKFCNIVVEVLIENLNQVNRIYSGKALIRSFFNKRFYFCRFFAHVRRVLPCLDHLNQLMWKRRNRMKMAVFIHYRQRRLSGPIGRRRYFGRQNLII